jgi:hypothetical protein
MVRAGAELQHRSVVDGPLVEALRVGGPSPTPGPTSAAAVELDALDAAIGHASVVGVVTEAARALVASAQTVRALRQAFKVGGRYAPPLAPPLPPPCDWAGAV